MGHSVSPLDYPDHYRLIVCCECRAAIELGKSGAWCHRCGAVDPLWMIALPHHVEAFDTRRGEATNRQAQAPLPASVSAIPEGSQRGLSGA